MYSQILMFLSLLRFDPKLASDAKGVIEQIKSTLQIDSRFSNLFNGDNYKLINYLGKIFVLKVRPNKLQTVVKLLLPTSDSIYLELYLLQVGRWAYDKSTDDLLYVRIDTPSSYYYPLNATAVSQYAHIVPTHCQLHYSSVFKICRFASVDQAKVHIKV